MKEKRLCDSSRSGYDVPLVMNASLPDPRSEYDRRLIQHVRELEEMTRKDLRISISRGIVFFGGVILFFLPVSGFWIVIPVLLFAFLVVAHDRILKSVAHVRSVIEFYKRGINRIEDEWTGSGVSGDRFLDASHPYSGDLDLFGRSSLFELLCVAQTRAGEETLASWLLRHAGVDSIRERQESVEELRPCLDFRESMVLSASEVRAEIHPEALAEWAERPAVPFAPMLRLVLLILSVLTVSSLIGWAFWTLPVVVFLSFAALEALFGRTLRTRVEKVMEGTETAASELRVLSHVLSQIEQQAFESAYLVKLRSSLDTEGMPPSVQIRGIGRLLEMLDSSRNQFFAPIAALLMWRTQFAVSLESWRRKCGPHIREWLATIGEFEALNSLACYAFEHPGDPFPEITEEGPFFEASALGHPLIPNRVCVRNDVALNAEQQMLIVSGSNMSGKSTLLRSVGINAVMAFAGAPVRASRLRLSSLSVGATIRVIDSLQQGTSRFYAEIKRLRHLLDLAKEPPPLLFLLDEILHGTNSLDRANGAEAVLKSFLRRGAIGLVTTHDLAITGIADRLQAPVSNVHFSDYTEEGEVHFDYRLRQGVVNRSNAIALMRSIGLEL